MTKRSTLLAVVLLLATLCGCVAPGQLAARDIQATLFLVCERHDAYVEADSTLTALQRRADLRDTQLLRQIVTEAMEGRP